MKTFKIIDLVGQLALVAVTLIYLLTKDSDQAFYTFYICVGSWQVLSFFINLAAGQKSTLRYGYTILLIGVFAVGVLCFLSIILIYLYLYILLFASPVLAAIYIAATIHELAALDKQSKTLNASLL